MKKSHALYCSLILSFILGVHHGYIALWESEDPEPVQIFPYAVTSLPEADQAALKRGIPIPNQAQLTKRLEDFLS